MNRKITQNKIVNEEQFKKVHPVNKQMLREFLPYLRTIDRSEKTIENYENCIQIAFTWNLDYNHNCPIYQWTRRGRQGKMLKCYTSVQFKKYLDLWIEERKRLGIESEYLLTSLRDPKQPISIISLNSWAECFSRYLGRPFYWHAIRHLTVTEFKRKGLPNEVIQQYIGWATADMVDKYNDLDADESFGDYFKAS